MAGDHKKYDLQKSSFSKEPTEAKERPMHPCLWKLMLLFGVFVYGSYTIFVHLCEKDGKLPFSTTSVNFLMEVLKLCISVGFLMPEILSKGVQVPSLVSSLPFAVPAVLYCFNNNIALHMQLHMDPATYQVLSNLKILSTALLYRLIMKRTISTMQWISLFMLMCAGLSNSYGGFHAHEGVAPSAGQIHISVTGLLMMAVFCTVSGLAGVYSEFIMKGKYELSIHIQNSMMYIYGVLMNAGVWLYMNVTSPNPEVSWNLFEGFNGYVWIILISQSVVGLIMSSIMKHGDSIMRLFMVSSAMLVTTVLSMLVFHLQLNTYFCLAFILVIAALVLYHNVFSLQQTCEKYITSRTASTVGAITRV